MIPLPDPRRCKSHPSSWRPWPSCREPARRRRPRPRSSPIVVLIAFDGWRWDYLERVPAPALRELARRGVRAESTAAGLPDADVPQSLHHRHRPAARPPRHHLEHDARSGHPRPVHAFGHTSHRQPGLVERRAHLADSHAPGAEERHDVLAGIGRADRRPLPVGTGVSSSMSCPPRERTAQAIEWLRLPDPQRPSLLTVYYSDLDTAGHDFGPELPKWRLPRPSSTRRLARLVDGRRRRSGCEVARALGDRERSRDDARSAAIGRSSWTTTWIRPPCRSSTSARGSRSIPMGLSVDAAYEALADRHPHLRVFRSAGTAGAIRAGRAPAPGQGRRAG